MAAKRRPPDAWSFTIKEVSANVYEVRAEAPDGLIMFRSGLDDYELLAKLIDDAWKLSE